MGDVERFWAKVRKTETCWLWTAGTRTGYGRAWFGGKLRDAHRVSYALFNGAVPAGLDVLHTCDNPGCVNPAHLRPGTHQENMDDKVAKGRQARGVALNRPQDGEKNLMAKLTEEDVADIFTNGLSGAECCRKYGASPGVVSEIRSRKLWPHVTAGLVRNISDGRTTRFYGKSS
jgi:hypothetical protein